MDGKINKNKGLTIAGSGDGQKACTREDVVVSGDIVDSENATMGEYEDGGVVEISGIKSKHSFEEQQQAGIYIIRNDINDLVYVGKTTDSFRSRWCDHKSRAKTGSTALYVAMQKIGFKHFSFSILEVIDKINHTEKDFLNAERFWIHYFKSNYAEYGYNDQQGLADRTSLHETDVFPLIIDLMLGLSYEEIANKYHTTSTVISEVKHGRLHKIEGISYPIVTFNERLHIENEQMAIQLLQAHPRYTYTDIHNITGIPRYRIQELNRTIGNFNTIHGNFTSRCCDNSSVRARKSLTIQEKIEIVEATLEVSQLATLYHTSESVIRSVQEDPHRCSCGRIIADTSTQCHACYLASQHKIDIPRNKLKDLIRHNSFANLAAALHVSQRRLRAYCRKHDLPDSRNLIAIIPDEEWDFACEHWNEVHQHYETLLSNSPTYLKRKPEYRASIAEEIISLCRDGYSITEITNQIPYDISTIRKILKEHELTPTKKHFSKRVKCIEADIEANSIQALAEVLKERYTWKATPITIQNKISNVLNGKLPAYHGLHFEFVE